MLPESAGQQHRVTCRGSRVNCGPPERRPRERPVDSGAPLIAKTSTIPSSRGTPSPGTESVDKTRVRFGVCEGRGEVREEHHWTSKECDPGERR